MSEAELNEFMVFVSDWVNLFRIIDFDMRVLNYVKRFILSNAS